VGRALFPTSPCLSARDIARPRPPRPLGHHAFPSPVPGPPPVGRALCPTSPCLSARDIARRPPPRPLGHQSFPSPPSHQSFPSPSRPWVGFIPDIPLPLRQATLLDHARPAPSVTSHSRPPPSHQSFPSPSRPWVGLYARHPAASPLATRGVARQRPPRPLSHHSSAFPFPFSFPFSKTLPTAKSFATTRPKICESEPLLCQPSRPFANRG